MKEGRKKRDQLRQSFQPVKGNVRSLKRLNEEVTKLRSGTMISKGKSWKGFT